MKNLNLMQRGKKGQSTTEYIIVVSAALFALIMFLRPNGTFRQAITEALSSTTDGMTTMSSRLSSSRDQTPSDNQQTIITSVVLEAPPPTLVTE